MKLAKAAATAASNSPAKPNLGGIGVYNADVENYLLQFLLVEQQDRPTSDLIYQLSMPPETMEFDRVGSLRRGQLNSANSSDSIDSGVGPDTMAMASSSSASTLVDGGPHQPQIRGRAATFDVYKIRTRIGSKVAQITKYTQEVLANKPTAAAVQKSSKYSPSIKRLLSTKRKSPSSLQIFHRSQKKSQSFMNIGEIFTSSGGGGRSGSNSITPPPSPGIAVVENGHIKGEMKSEGGQVTSSNVEGDERKGERTKAHSVDDIDAGSVAQRTKEKKTPRSVDSSPRVSPKFSRSSKMPSQQKAKSSDNIADLTEIDLADIEMTEKQSISSELSSRPMSPLDGRASSTTEQMKR